MRHYRAFISYSRHDRRIARQLQQYIERRRIPRHFRRELGLGTPTLTPVFRDESDLPAHGHLSEALKEALAASDYLIVICSPYAAASSYVDQEITYFKSLGRTSRILCVIAGGVPHASRDTSEKARLECLPRALRYAAGEPGDSLGELVPDEDLPLAADLRVHDGELPPLEADRIVAGMLGVTLRALQGQMHRSARIRRGAAVATVAVLLAGGGVAWDAQLRMHEAHFRGAVRTFGMWTGVDRLDMRGRPAPAVAYRFVRRGRSGPVVRVELINGSGGVAPDALNSVLGNTLTRECTVADVNEVRFEYGSDGAILSETYVSKHGVVVERLQYTGGSVAQFIEADFGCSRTPSGIQYVRFTRDAQGFTQRIEFLDADRRPAPNTKRVYGYEYRHAIDGRQVSSTAIDSMAVPMDDSDGVSTTLEEWDPERRILQWRVLDKAARPVVLGNRIAGRRDSLDGSFNVVKREFLGVDGRLTFDSSGIAGYRAAFDRHGNRIRRVYMGLDGQPVLARDGEAEERVEYDRRGYAIGVSYFDLNGNHVLRRGGYAGFRQERDAFGSEVRISYYGLDGQPMLTDGGYASRSDSLDAQGFIIERRYRGVDELPILDTARIAGYRIQWDTLGRRASVSYFGTEGEAVYITRGFAAELSEYDERGNVRRLTWVDVDGKPTIAHDGSSGRSREHNSAGDITRETRLGLLGQALPDAAGVAGWDYGNDAYGRLTSLSHVDASGNVVAGPDGWARAEYEYNSAGHQVKETDFDSGGERYGDGFEIEMDARGNWLMLKIFDEEGKSSLNSYGIAAVRFEYDARDNQIRHTYLGLHGEPVVNADGYSSAQLEFDHRGNQTRITYFGLQDEAVLLPSGIAGDATEYDAGSRKVSERYFGLEGEPVLLDGGYAETRFGYAEIRYGYDDRGNQTSTCYFGTDGQPVLNDEACVHDEFDARRNLLRRHYTGSQKEPMIHPVWGYAGREMVYNDRDQEIGRRHFGVRNETVSSTFADQLNYARRERRYSSTGQLLIELHYDVMNNPIMIRPGIYADRHTYDANGALIAREPVTTPEGQPTARR